jgi:hypothetical protein
VLPHESLTNALGLNGAAPAIYHSWRGILIRDRPNDQGFWQSTFTTLAPRIRSAKGLTTATVRSTSSPAMAARTSRSAPIPAFLPMMAVVGCCSPRAARRARQSAFRLCRAASLFNSEVQRRNRPQLRDSRQVSSWGRTVAQMRAEKGSSAAFAAVAAFTCWRGAQAHERPLTPGRENRRTHVVLCAGLS